MSKAKTQIPMHDLSEEQAKTLDVLRSGENVFVTGGAGSGKSYLIRHFMRELDPKQMPVLASTGAAAVLLGGRTFHSFFGLGIMEGGPQATLERALQNGRLMKRIASVEGIIIDEISMIPGVAFEVAEAIARTARESELPWGGMRIIVVGDFAQLPPVSRSDVRKKDWSFQNPVWEKTGFQNCLLSHNQRVEDDHFLDVLADVRNGVVSSRVRDLLSSHMFEDNQNDKSLRLFSRRDHSQAFNERELHELVDKEERIPSIYLGLEKQIEMLKKASPVPEELVLKRWCKVMFIQNDPQKRWVNGTRGTVLEISADKITIEKENGRDVTVEKTQFSMLDADGKIVASVINFPLVLAYATTIHKSQGATLDRVWVNISHLWEPGHAYVALSRLRSSNGLFLLGWNPRSIIVDPNVQNFYQNLHSIV